MNPHVFREYDIRGHAERDFDDELVRELGLSLGTFFSGRGLRRIAVGRDCRVSSPRLHEALCSGLVETGLQLTDIGIGPTPLLYFAVHSRDLDGGIHITGSHNPPEENGFKMMVGKASLYGADIAQVRHLMETKQFHSEAGGAIECVDPTPAYVQTAKEGIRLGRRDIRFALDAGNGAGGPLGIETMTALGLAPIAMLCEMDGTFPVHHADPTDPKTLEMLRERVLSDNLELGFAFDGDADRLGVIDARGDIIWGDRLMIILSRALLAEHPGATIIGEVKCSQTLYDDIEAHGGRGLLWKTGHSLIKTKMKKEGALLAGEMSGHIFFADRYYGFDDAIYAALRILEIVSHTSMPIHEMLSDVPKTFTTPEIRVPCDDGLKFDVVRGIVEHYRSTHELVDIDGARIQFEGGWGLVRASNTQPVLVLRFEAASQGRLEAIRGEVESVLGRIRDAG
ncbi:MAG: phosphomannomutase/phosphoglucomutase [Myxococcales bacterium]|nr:phosphomannomutase/phosphoglucomutase [Myxococcales bacterium]MDH3484720.1 phosphomannomutase/phosphoglucomutase [Myxococcales bacterium]